MNRKLYIYIFLLSFAWVVSAQINNTGLPISLSSGVIVWTEMNFASSGDISNEGALELKGEVEISGNYEGAGSFTLNGGDQNVAIIPKIPSTLTIIGGNKVLLSDLTVQNIDLTSSASIVTGDNAIQVDGEMTGYDDVNNIQGKLIRSGSDSLFYPISNDSQYVPVTLTNVLGTSPAIGVSGFETAASGSAGYRLLALNENRHWVITEDGGNFVSAIIELPLINETIAVDPSELTIAKQSGISSFSGLGLATSSGDLSSGYVKAITPSGAGIYTIGKYFDEALRVNDSLALVSIYDNLLGLDWIENSGWLESNLNSWSGIGISEKRVSGISLPNNNMVGTYPDVTNGLETLASIELQGNDIDSLPELTRFTGLTTADFSNNPLDFASLEPNLAVTGFAYDNQKKVGLETDTLLEQSAEPYTISREIGGSANTYSWFKRDKSGNSTAIGGTSATQELTVQSFDDEGYYYAMVTNSNVPDLTLTTNDIFVKVSSLERDRVALMELYTATSGGSWTNSAGWNADQVSNDWFGITVENNRVTGVSLPLNNMDGNVPESFADLASLTTVNLENNSLRSFPKVTGISTLSSLDLSGNRLVFNDIVPNITVPNFDYLAQKRFGTTVYDTIDAGSDYELKVAALGDVTTQYQWKFAPLIPGQPYNNDVSSISGANVRSYTINDINIDNQGTYRVEVTHPKAPGLTIQSRNQNIMAQTNFFGSLTVDGEPITDGEVVIWRKTSQGPYRQENTTEVDENGNYALEDVVLGTFLVLARPARNVYPDVLQTYYVSQQTYSKADSLYLDNVSEGINIEMITINPELPVSTGATIAGFIELDFADPEDEESGRTASRRKVRKAACSMRRFKSQGRPEQDSVETEIAYYIETDDEGYFNFEGVDEGKYLINIEFPGVPMDNSSEVVFEIGGDKENQVFEVNALITELGIEIEQTEILYTLKPFIKDLKFYPNPTDGILALDYTVYRNVDDLHLQLTTMEGRVIRTADVPHRKGRWHTELDMTDVSVGIYHLVFTDKAGTFRESVKVGRN